MTAPVTRDIIPRVLTITDPTTAYITALDFSARKIYITVNF
jgi:hypothetical protein